MEGQWFKRRWDESRGDQFDSRGAATYFIEVGDDGSPTHQVEIYENGQTLRYGQDRTEDEYGQLGNARLDALEDWSRWGISVESSNRSGPPRSSSVARLTRHMSASHFGMRCGMIRHMSTQIAVRLPDEMVAFLDRTVATGKSPSRAALVASAVEREMRRQAAEQDAQILRQRGAEDDLDDLVQWGSAHIEVED